MLLEILLSSIILTSNGNNHHTSNIVFTPGDSYNTRVEQGRERAERDRERLSSLQAEQDDRSVEKPTDPELLYPDNTNNCVQWAKDNGYVPRGSYGFARNIPVDNETSGGWVVTYESRWGHIAKVLEVKAETVVVEDSNVVKGWITKREISKSVIKGFLE